MFEVMSSPTPTPTRTLTPTVTRTVTPTITRSATVTPTRTLTPTVTPSVTTSSTVTPTLTTTRTPTPTLTKTPFPTPTPTPSVTVSSSARPSPRKQHRPFIPRLGYPGPRNNISSKYYTGRRLIDQKQFIDDASNDNNFVSLSDSEESVWTSIDITEELSIINNIRDNPAEDNNQFYFDQNFNIPNTKIDFCTPSPTTTPTPSPYLFETLLTKKNFIP